MPNYNTMGLAKASLEASVRYLAASLGPKGIRVNGISAGPIKTLAASGIKGFGKILDVVEANSPLRRNVTIDDVGNVAAFLLSDLAAGITGRDHLRRRRLQPRDGAAPAARRDPLPPGGLPSAAERLGADAVDVVARRPRATPELVGRRRGRGRRCRSPGTRALNSRVKRRYSTIFG